MDNSIDPGQKSPGAIPVAGFARNLLSFENRLFTEFRVRFYGSGVIVAAVVALLASLGRGRWGIGLGGRFPSIDFCWIWASGKLAAAGYGARIYDPGIFMALHDTFFRPGECIFDLVHQYAYPPTLLFFTYPLGLLPYLAAFAVWMAATLAVCEWAVYAISPAVPR